MTARGGLCAVVLAAGEGRRLRPLTEQLPKALCPVGNVALLDHALRRVGALGLGEVAVNASYLAARVVARVGDRAHLSVEPDGPLGTAGGIGNLRAWIDGRGVLVGNSDAYLADPHREPGKDIAALLDGWSGETVRMLTLPVLPGDTGGFSGRRFAGFSLLPWRRVSALKPEPSDLVRLVWRPAEAAGELELIGYDGIYIDTGTPADYLRANLHAARTANALTRSATANGPARDPMIGAGATVAGTAPGSMIGAGATVTGTARDSVIGADARVAGEVTRCVVWPGASVAAGESLTDAIRAGDDLTVPAGPAGRPQAGS